MRTTRIRWIAAVLTCLGCGLLVATPTGAFAAQHSHSVVAKKKPVLKGFYVGTTRVTKTQAPAALTRDADGGQHVVTTVVSPSAPGDQGRFDYITHKPGTTKWLSHIVPGLHPLAGGVQVEIHMSTDLRRVFAVFYECDGVYVADTSLASTRLPQPTQVVAEDNCTAPTATSNEPPMAHAIALPSHRIGILLPDPAQDNEPAIFAGTPGGTFTPGTALPTTDSFVPELVTPDLANSRTIVVGEGSDGTNEGIYVVSQGIYSSEWSAPRLIASLASPTTDYKIEALTAYNGSTWVGLLRPLTAGSHAKHTLFIVHGTASGQWIGAIPLPRSTTQDTSLRLEINIDTLHLHAAFTRVNPASKVKKSGIMQEARTKTWAKPQFLTHWYRDYTDQITFTNKGKAVVSYNRK